VQGKDFLLKREIPFFEKSKHFWQVATTKILSSIFVLARSQEQDNVSSEWNSREWVNMIWLKNKEKKEIHLQIKGMSQYDLIEEQGEEGNPFANDALHLIWFRNSLWSMLLAWFRACTLWP
jgi:hypothetical protein